MNSFSVLGDLCREVEWIWRRMQCATRSIQRCQNLQLKERLVEEISFHRYRCLVIKTALASTKHCIDSQSIQKRLLEELLSRCLLKTQVLYQF